MTLNQLVCRAASVYPEAFILQYWAMEKQEPKANPGGGDTLALFVAQELADTYDADAGDADQIATAVSVMQSAAADLAAIAFALERLGQECLAA